MAGKRPSYTQDNLTLVGEMTSQSLPRRRDTECPPKRSLAL